MANVEGGAKSKRIIVPCSSIFLSGHDKDFYSTIVEGKKHIRRVFCFVYIKEKLFSSQKILEEGPPFKFKLNETIHHVCWL